MATYTDPTIVQLGAKNRIHSYSWLILAAGVISVLGAGWILFRTSQAGAEGDRITQEITGKEAQVKSLKSVADQAADVQQLATTLQAFFSGQKRWEVVAATIEQRLYKNMTVTSLQMSSDGKLTLGGSTPTYVDYAKIFRAFTDADGQKYFSAVKPTAVAKTEADEKNPANVQFTFELKLQPQILNANKVTSLTDLTPGGLSNE